MSTLHGLLAELGIEGPQMHPEREFSKRSGWVVDQAFHPLPGHAYEVVFGEIAGKAAARHVVKQIHIDAAAPNRWFELETHTPLPSSLQTMAVKAYRRLD